MNFRQQFIPDLSNIACGINYVKNSAVKTVIVNIKINIKWQKKFYLALKQEML